MATRWAVGRDFWNALSRGTLTSPHEDSFHATANLADYIPMKAARFAVTGQNDVLLDSDLLAGGATCRVLAGETLRLLSGGTTTIFNQRTQDYLQSPGTSWGPASSNLTPPLSFTVQDYDRMQRTWATLTVTGSTPVLIPRLSALSIHGHEGLYQTTTAIQWHAGAASNPTGLVVQGLPLQVPQLLEASSPVLLQFHRLTFFGALPYVGEATLTDPVSITAAPGAGE